MAASEDAPKKAKAEMGSKCEFKIYQERKNKKSDKFEKVAVSRLNEALGDAETEGEDKPYAFVVTQKFTEQSKLEKTIVQIQSPQLLTAFRDVIKSYPTVPVDFAELEPVELESPFQMLFHYWDELDAHRRTTDDDKIRMHLNLLFEFMEAEIGPARDKHLAMIKKGQITFKTLWTMFRPGDLVYRQMDGHPWLLRCTNTVYEESSTAGPYCEVHCRYTEFDGTHLGEADANPIVIYQKRAFGGDNPGTIVELSAYPRKFRREGKELEERLDERGRKYLAIRESRVIYYDGIAQYMKEPPSDYYGNDLEYRGGIWLPFWETARVVLDTKTFNEENSIESVTMRSGTGEPNRILCPPFSLGYSLTRKCWCRFYLDNQSDIAWDRGAWDKLILEDDQKLVLKSLILSHAFPENPRDQFQQKGKGLVMLLHGSPGSGKTLTAETAAEVSEKALYSTTMGELNKEDSPYWFEYRLQKALQYATTWKAVLLLDEADVFLEARDGAGFNSTERNALVAVFLKNLEFFSGIVFLTTNRIHSFDPAMKSRIHMAMGFTPPGLDTRRSLWVSFLKKIPQDDIDMDPEEDADELIRDRLNGREISYAINSARTIARSQKQPLRLEHIQTILRVRRDFDKSLTTAAKHEEKRSSSGMVSGGGSFPVRRQSILEADEYHS